MDCADWTENQMNQYSINKEYGLCWLNWGIRFISLIYIQLIGNQRYQMNLYSINREYGLCWLNWESEESDESGFNK